ncbi:hypothetical protein V6N13_047666 [Hibiscus sabdariffa]
MLEDVNWSYLREIFSEVGPWLKKLIFERATWLEIRGLPLHYWNGTSLKRIAEKWGKVEALGVNANHTHDCEKATVLISTEQIKRFEEVETESISNSTPEEKEVAEKDGGRTLHNEYELMGGVPKGDLVLIEMEVTAVEGEEKRQAENLKGVGCLENKSGG